MLVNQRLKIFARHSYLKLCCAVEIVVATSNSSGENKTDWGLGVQPQLQFLYVSEYLLLLENSFNNISSDLPHRPE